MPGGAYIVREFARRGIRSERRRQHEGIVVKDGVASIPLSGRVGKGLLALVDEKDLATLKNYTWSASKNKEGYICAATTVIGEDRSKKTVKMHQIVRPGCFEVDHINGNPLDNRRSNLRPSSSRQNQQNRKLHRNNTSGFKGVTWRADQGRWSAQIKREGGQRHLGYFSSVESAARAYDDAARAAFGQFARLNFPKAGEMACNNN